MSTLIFGPIDYRLGRQVFILESRVRFPVGLRHINSSTHTADGGLSKIQFRTAGSRMLESVFIANQALLQYGFIPVGYG